MDMDASIHDQARARIEKLLAVDSRGSKLKTYTHVRNFKYIKSVLGGVDENLLDVGVNDILMDLGISSIQVDDSTRGFSVQGDGPLDMRMNPQASLTAEEILNSWPAAEVGKVLREYGEESNWQFIQNQIVEARAQGGLHTTDELVHLVRRASSKSGGKADSLGKNVLEALKEMIPSRDEEIKLKQYK
ncbi:ribosomal RNA small subunit methyltransferase H-like [Zingiber officinale]|uniref:ribosomal RNA small subunit methyltransferase H-like n=1 Tax=Zingiber officinale TaxID=94328 RepID=UPI001C4AA616|nr:ribosomal RNA small subunit methyltransferase H-like [Zingiber officinale]